MSPVPAPFEASCVYNSFPIALSIPIQVAPQPRGTADPRSGPPAVDTIGDFGDHVGVWLVECAIGLLEAVSGESMALPDENATSE